MGIIATAVRHLMAAGVAGEDLLRAIEEMEGAAPQPSTERKRSTAAIRQQAYRERMQASQNVTRDVTCYGSEDASQTITEASHVTFVTSQSVTGYGSDDEENPAPNKSPQTPKINPTPQAHTRTHTREGTRLPADWTLPDDWREFASTDRGWNEADITGEAEQFRDYWLGKPGKDGRKADWHATWRNWVRRSHRASSSSNGGGSPGGYSSSPRSPAAASSDLDVLCRMAEGYGNRRASG
jgi:hypothetical protein